MPVSQRAKKILWGFAAVGAVVFVGAQLVPVKGVNSNPPERFKLDAPPHVEAILRRACLDCHSNETRWPLYSRIAPGSWLMARDVNRGRQHLNISEWGDTDEEERQMDLETAWDQVESGAMPPWFYVYPLHLDARLSVEDKAALKAWMLKPRSDQTKGDGSGDGADDKDQKDKKAAEPIATQRPGAPTPPAAVPAQPAAAH